MPPSLLVVLPGAHTHQPARFAPTFALRVLVDTAVLPKERDHQSTCAYVMQKGLHRKLGTCCHGANNIWQQLCSTKQLCL